MSVFELNFLLKLQFERKMPEGEMDIFKWLHDPSVINLSDWL